MVQNNLHLIKNVKNVKLNYMLTYVLNVVIALSTPNFSTAISVRLATKGLGKTLHIVKSVIHVSKIWIYSIIKNKRVDNRKICKTLALYA